MLLLGCVVAFGSWWWVSGRYTTVPNVLNVSLEEAQTLITDRGLKVAAEPKSQFSETVPANMVLAATPGPGDRILPGHEVSLVVSSGAERFAVPDVTNQSQGDATATLGTIPVQVVPSQASDDSVPSGNVIRTDPPVGTQVKRDQVITLYVSTGPPVIAVPDVVGRTQTDAESALTATGFTPSVAQEYSETIAAGVVIRQSPDGSTNAVKFSTVTIVVSRGPELVTIPQIANGTPTAAATATLKALGLTVQVHQNFGGLLDQVVGMNPPAGTKVRKGSTVTLETV